MSEATEHQRIKNERLKLEQQINQLATDYEKKTGFRVDIVKSPLNVQLALGDYSGLSIFYVSVQVG